MPRFRNYLKIKYMPSKSRRIGKRGEKKVKDLLEKNLIKNSFKILNNFTFLDNNNCSHQIDHILIFEKGIFCIETKNYSGFIKGEKDDNTWKVFFPRSKEEYSFQNPLKQNTTHIYKLKKLLDEKYEIFNIIIFAKNNIKDDFENGILNLKSMVSYLKKVKSDYSISKKEINEIFKNLKSHKIKMSNFEHVNNVKNFASSLKEFKCPKCGSHLLQKNGPYGPFYYCSNFKNCDFKKKKLVKTKKPNSLF